jgi:hypothetical protein
MDRSWKVVFHCMRHTATPHCLIHPFTHITCQARNPWQLTGSAGPSPEIRKFSLISFNQLHHVIPKKSQPSIIAWHLRTAVQESHLVFSPTLFAYSNDMSGQATATKWSVAQPGRRWALS